MTNEKRDVSKMVEVIAFIGAFHMISRVCATLDVADLSGGKTFLLQWLILDKFSANGLGKVHEVIY